METNSLDTVLKEIYKLHETYPPHKRTPKINKQLEELYEMECKLRNLQFEEAEKQNNCTIF